jgi:nucleoside-diphosphate-sugar epimerase
MTKIGLTGSTGSLGKIILKNYHNFKFSKFQGDIRKKNEINKWIKKNNITIIFHLAAIVPIKEVNKNKKKAKEVNFFGTKNLIDACIKKNIEWFFFSSTSHVYSSSKKKISEKSKLSPISYYGRTKLLAENYIVKKLEKENVNYCIGRIFSTTNKNQKRNYLVPDLKHKIQKMKKKIVLKNLNHYRDFISMEDIAKIIFFLLKKKYKGIINFGTGHGTYLKDIAKIIAKKHEKDVIFNDNKKITHLVADITKLKNIYKIKFSKKIEKKIF